MFVYIPGLAPEGGHRARGWEIKKRDISCEPGAAGATEEAALPWEMRISKSLHHISK